VEVEHFGDLEIMEVKQFQEATEYFGAQLRDAHPTVGVCYVAF